MRSEVHFFWYIVLLALFQRRKSVVQGFTISLLENHFGEAKLGLILRKSPLCKVKVDFKSTLWRVRKIQSPNIELFFFLTQDPHTCTWILSFVSCHCLVVLTHFEWSSMFYTFFTSCNLVKTKSNINLFVHFSIWSKYLHEQVSDSFLGGKKGRGVWVTFLIWFCKLGSHISSFKRLLHQ